MKLFEEDINSISIEKIYSFFKLDNEDDLKKINLKLNEYISEISSADLSASDSNNLINEITKCRNRLINNYHKHYEIKIPIEESTYIEESNNIVLQNG